MSTLLAVPNVSAAGDRATVDALGEAFTDVGVSLLETHSDLTHNRSVFTLAGEGTDLVPALITGAGAVIAGVDLGAHRGAHPRIGALDVCPLVWIDAESRPEAERLAREALAPDLAGAGLPVFFYGALATSAGRRERSHFRRGGFESLAGRMASGELDPDLGPAAPHPTAGAVLVTARPPLAAFNVELEGIELERGHEIAAGVREAGGGLRGVRAIALALPSGRTQISTNVHDPVAIPLGEVVADIQRRAVPLGGRAVAAELVGLLPEAALDGYPDDVPIRGFDPARHTIEARLAALDDPAV